MPNKEKLEKLRTMFDTLVDLLDSDQFNPIRYEISEANTTLDELIDREIERFATNQKEILLTYQYLLTVLMDLPDEVLVDIKRIEKIFKLAFENEWLRKQLEIVGAKYEIGETASL